MDTERRHPRHVAVLGVDANPADVLCLGEPQVDPRFARVGGLVDAISLLDVATQFRLTRPDVHHVGIGLANLDSAHRGAVDLPIGDRGPCGAPVCGFPEPTAGCAEVVLQRSRVAARGGRRAASTRRAHVSPL